MTGHNNTWHPLEKKKKKKNNKNHLASYIILDSRNIFFI